MANRHPYYYDAHNVGQGNLHLQIPSYHHPNRPFDPYPSPTSTVHSPVSVVPVLTALEQQQYGHVVDGHVVEFRTFNGRPIDLYQALGNGLEQLIEKDDPAFPPHLGVRAKASIRIQIRGLGTYTRQFMSLRSNKDGTSISKGKLAHTVAKEVKKMMKGDVLHVPGVGSFRMEQIYLTKLVRVSRGSWQPELKVPAPDANP